MKKHFLILIIFFVSFAPKVFANFGDVNYEIASVDISGSNITFKGWAFIHRTHNFTKVTGNSTNSGNAQTIYSENFDNGMTDGGQKIMIIVKNEDNKEILRQVVDGKETIEIDGHSINYNFYYPMYHRHSSETNPENTYYFKYGNNSSTINNLCIINGEKDTLEKSNCYYEDIGFEITIDLSSASGNKLRFEIAVSNNDFEKKINNYKKATTTDKAGNIYTQPEKLSLIQAAINKTKNDNIDISDSYGNLNKVKFIASSAMLMKMGTSGLYTEYVRGIDGNNYPRYGIPEEEYTISTDTTKPSYIKNVSSTRIFTTASVYIPGRYAICTEEDTKNVLYRKPSSSCKIINYAYASWVKPSGDFYLKVTGEKLCTRVNPNTDKLNCNGNKTLKSDCSELTVKKDGVRANVKINQKGYISSILTPTKTYAGGPFKFGILYRNEISWDYAGTNNLSDSDKSKIQQAMQDKIYDLDTIKNNIKLENIKFGKENPSFDNFNIECNQSNNGIFTAGETLITYCTIFLPTSIANENDDEVIYKRGGDENKGINNVYYTPRIYVNNNYTLSTDIKGLNIIKETYRESDSKTKGVSWTGNWDTSIANCNIELYPLLNQDGGDGTVKFLPIYRPIDINNPFPNNRTPGFNWLEWYSKDSNKQRLKETYSKPQYSISLDQATINNIKDYNKNHNYLEWEIENNESDFINEYRDKFSILRQNIVGDSK